MKVSRHCVTTTIGRYINGGGKDPTIRTRYTRKKRASNSVQDEQLVNLSTNEPFLKPRELKLRLGMKASLTTVKRRLAAAGLHGFRAPSKPSLTVSHKHDRLRFALQHHPTNQLPDESQSLNAEVHNMVVTLHASLQPTIPFDWDCVAFSDESIICTSDHGVQWVRRPKNKRWEPKFMAENTRGNRLSVSVWAIISKQGLGPIVKVNGRMNSVQYCERILNSEVLPYMRQNPNLIFQQDNASIHRSRYTSSFLAHSGIPVLQGWPPKSPDLSLIENIWHALKVELVGKVEHLKGKRKEDQLWQIIKTAWKKLSDQDNPRITQNLYNGMYKRLDHLIKHGGGSTPY